MDFPPIYIDAEEVERGHYVYAHVCKQTAKVFYVGRGKRGRAWDKEKRSEAWKKFVAGLPDGHEVVLLHRDLTEDESVPLERKEIEAHGGAASQGGTLINWNPGDVSLDVTLGIEVTVDLPAGDEQQQENEAAQHEAYLRVRKFKQMTRAEKLACLDRFDAMVDPSLSPLEVIIERCERREACYPSGVDDACDAADGIRGLASRLRRQGISYLNFCLEIEGHLEQLELALDDTEPRYRKKVKACYDALWAWFSLFDTGNREEALDAAHAEWERQGGLEKLRQSLPPERRRELGLDGHDSQSSA